MEPAGQEQRADSSGPPIVGHELRDLRPRNIALFGAALVIVIGLVLAVSHWIFEYNAARQAKEQIAPSPLAHTRVPTPEPHLQVYGAQDLQEMRAAEDRVLNGYAWIDKNAGIVRIPVDRAIALLAKKGLPVRPQGSMQQAKSERQKVNGTSR